LQILILFFLKDHYTGRD